MISPHHRLDTINVSDSFAMRYWARQLRVSETQLREAIAVVGCSAAAVRQHLGKPERQPHRAGRPLT